MTSNGIAQAHWTLLVPPNAVHGAHDIFLRGIVGACDHRARKWLKVGGLTFSAGQSRLDSPVRGQVLPAVNWSLSAERRSRTHQNSSSVWP